MNHLFFDVLPHLQDGVYVHLHDIFYGFEYPQAWIERGFRLGVPAMTYWSSPAERRAAQP